MLGFGSGPTGRLMGGRRLGSTRGGFHFRSTGIGLGIMMGRLVRRLGWNW